MVSHAQLRGCNAAFAPVPRKKALGWAMLHSPTRGGIEMPKPAISGGGHVSPGTPAPGRAAPRHAPAETPIHPATTGNYSAREEAELRFIFLVNVSFSPRAEG